MIRSLKGYIFFFTILICTATRAQLFSLNWNLDQFIADTMCIRLLADSIMNENPQAGGVEVIDQRYSAPRLIGIKQIRKWKYIPVDQFIVLSRPLSDVMETHFRRDSLPYGNTLIIKNLALWYDSQPYFNKGRKLNAYTTLIDDHGKVKGDWIWEFTRKPKRKEADSSVVVRLMERWIQAQSEAIRKGSYHVELYPYLYRRQLMSWSDFILMQDGFALNAHLTLDYPGDQFARYVRGSPGIFYRRSSRHESIAIGGKNQLWYQRLNSRFLTRLDVTLRMGFNSFSAQKFSHVDYWNIVYLGMAANAAVEFRPVYLKGLFLGAGLHCGVNILPDNVERIEPGVMIIVGILLP